MNADNIKMVTVIAYEGMYSAILATITDGENRIDEYILVDEE